MNISRLLAILLILLVLGFVTGTCSGQDTGKDTGNHDHESHRLSRWRLLRVLPAKVTNVEKQEFGTRIEYVANDRFEIQHGYVQSTKETKGVTPKRGEFYWLIFCNADKHAYAIYELEAEQRKAVKF